MKMIATALLLAASALLVMMELQKLTGRRRWSAGRTNDRS